jgi:HEAT repeat protein
MSSPRRVIARTILSLVILTQMALPNYAFMGGNAGGPVESINQAVTALRASEAGKVDASRAIDVFLKSTERTGKDGVAPLIQVLGDQGKGAWLVRVGAILALAKIGEPAIPDLFKQLNYPSPQVSFGAADALALIGGNRVTDQAEKGLQAGSIKEKQRLIYMLGHIGGKRSKSLLVGALRDYRLHKEAGIALRNIGYDAISDLIEVIRQSDYADPKSMAAGFEAARSLSEMGEPALRALADTVGSCSIDSAAASRSTSASTIGQSSAACSCSAAYGLVFMGEAAIPTLLGFASNYAPDTASRNVRGLAMQGLSDMGVKAVAPVIDFISSRERSTDAKLSAKVGLTILGSIADRSAETFITEFKGRVSDPSLNRLSTWALDKIAARDARAKSQPAPAPRLRTIASSQSIPDLIEALRRAEAAGDDTAIAFTNIVAAAQARGEAAIPDLLQVLADQGQRHWVVRMAAVSGLAAVGDAAVPTLSEKVRDSNPQISFGASDALAQIGGQKVLEISERKLNGQNRNIMDQQRAIYLLGRSGNKKSIDILVRMLRNDDLQYDAAIALHDIGDAAIPEMLKVVKGSTYGDSQSMTAAFNASRVLTTLGEPGRKALASVEHKAGDVDSSARVAASFGWVYERERSATLTNK